MLSLMSSPVLPLLSPVLQRFLGQPEIPVETAVRVYRRYLQLEPTHAEEFIAYLKSKVRGVRGGADTSPCRHPLVT
jgi:hypothetical protein